MNSKKSDKATKGEIGKQIKVARKKLKLTQLEVAKKAKMTVNYYAMIERGEVNPSLEKMKNITNALNLKLTIS